MTWTNPSPRSTQAVAPAKIGRRLVKWIMVTGAALVALVALAVVVALLVNARNDPDPTRLVGQPAPEFILPELVGRANDVGVPTRSVRRDSPAAPLKQVTASGHLGHVWVLHTFGTWCRPCNEEHAALVMYASTHHVPIVGVDQGDEPPSVLAWLAKHGNPYSAVVADVTGEVAEAYDVKGVPQYFVIDAAGIIRARFYGPLEESEIEKRLAPWVASVK